MYVIQSKNINLSHSNENWKTETLPMSRHHVDLLLKKKMEMSSGEHIYRAIQVD